MGSGHGHGHGHGHGMGGVTPGEKPTRARIKRMLIGLAILSVFLVLELTVGLMINSLALIADAGHMLTDVVALLMGLAALTLAHRGSSKPERTFGWHRAEVLTAIANAVLLIGIAVYIFIEAIGRIGAAPDVPGVPLILVALAGLAANVVVLYLLRSGSKESIAMKGAYMEVLADAVSSVGVLVAGVLTLAFGWVYADVVVGVLISIWIVPRAVALARTALRILTQASPATVDVPALEADLRAIPGVENVHDLHVWTLTTGMDVVTVHLTTRADNQAVLRSAKSLLSSYGLEHATVQIDSPGEKEHCEETVTW
ncbi:cation diffusion facilitator family transporter [Hoyosella subflava]|uniref:Cobalt-zinc-cadmium efflux permease n=1 Tax=Hoyosella subflava (strain DSM 45089 / JCM 17490 / NBRC 109087 / DQS3-9A1) TaxID=443218 RepID=F6EIN7_HOYSD|nr:cation diffusion facilitator family transporter [Hoyosella subflava]AEF38962.1 Cobalt-zinc-cadmium efflux permease [Hoyosella subflava DQS3-9A1]